MSLVMVGRLPRAWARNVGMGRLASRRGLGGHLRGVAGLASGYPDFASYNSAVCLPLSGANVCPPPFDPSCVGPASAAVSACQAAWVSDPTSCHNVVCNASGQPAVTYQPYTTPAGTAAVATGYNTTTGFVPVVQVPAGPPAASTVVGVHAGPGPNPVPFSASPPPTSTAPAVTSYNPQLTFTTSRGSTALQPGDTWQLSITGAPPNMPLILSATSPATPSGAAGPMGSTDGAGNFSLSGTITPDQAGTWSESWSVAGKTIGSFSFTVTVPPAAPAPGTGATGTPVTTPAPTGTSTVTSPYYLGPAPPQATSPAVSVPQDMTGGAAASIPTWVWIAGAAAVAFLAFKGK